MTTERDLFGDLDYKSRKGLRTSLRLRFVEMKSMPEGGHNAYLYKFQDKEGNKFNWFTNALKALVVGNVYPVSAIVGRPKRFRNEISTRLKDCRIGKAK